MIAAYGDDLTRIVLEKGGKGQFDVLVDGQQFFSKGETHRHAEPGEIPALIGSRSKQASALLD